jgi:hypothetical protein
MYHVPAMPLPAIDENSKGKTNTPSANPRFTKTMQALKGDPHTIAPQPQLPDPTLLFSYFLPVSDTYSGQSSTRCINAALHPKNFIYSAFFSCKNIVLT